MLVRLVIADAVTLARLGYVTALAGHADIELVGQAPDAASAERMVEALRPDVVTIDADLGLESAFVLRRDHPRLGIIITGPCHDESLITALEAGLSGYLPRTAPVEQLLSAIRHAAVSPLSFTAPELAQALSRRRQRSPLSPREREVFEQLATGASLTTIARKLSLTESTVRTYVARVYDKLDVRTRAEAMRLLADG